MELKKRKINKAKYWKFSYFCLYGLIISVLLIYGIIMLVYPETSNLVFGIVMFIIACIYVLVDEIFGKKYYLEDCDDGSDR